MYFWKSKSISEKSIDSIENLSYAYITKNRNDSEKNDHKIIDKNVRSIYNRGKQKEPMPAKTPTLKGSTPILPN